VVTNVGKKTAAVWPDVRVLLVGWGILIGSPPRAAPRMSDQVFGLRLDVAYQALVRPAEGWGFCRYPALIERDLLLERVELFHERCHLFRSIRASANPVEHLAPSERTSVSLCVKGAAPVTLLRTIGETRAPYGDSARYEPDRQARDRVPRRPGYSWV
jgi:hypothetical protein